MSSDIDILENEFGQEMFITIRADRLQINIGDHDGDRYIVFDMKNREHLEALCKLQETIRHQLGIFL